MNFFNAEQANELANLCEEEICLIYITEVIKKKAMLGSHKLVIDRDDYRYHQVAKCTHELEKLGYCLEYDFDDIVIEW